MTSEVLLAVVNMVQVLGLAYLAVRTQQVHKAVNGSLAEVTERAERCEHELDAK